MNLTNARATFGLNAKATPTKSGSSGTVQIGDSNESISLSSATKIVSFDAVIVGGASSLVIDISDLDNTGTTSWTAGAQQVETNTVVAGSGITTSGNATVTVTDGGHGWSPKAISVPLTTATHTSATLIAAALAAGVNADAQVSLAYTASSSGANLILKSVATDSHVVNGTTVSLWPADAPDLNVAIANGTCVGITNDATSTSTTAGVLTAGVYCPDLDGNDFEGEASGGLSAIHAFFVKNNSSSVSYCTLSQGLTLASFPVFAGSSLMVGGAGTSLASSDLTFGTITSCHVTVTIAGL